MSQGLLASIVHAAIEKFYVPNTVFYKFLRVPQGYLSTIAGILSREKNKKAINVLL